MVLRSPLPLNGAGSLSGISTRCPLSTASRTAATAGAHCATAQPHAEALAAIRAEIVKAGDAPQAVYDLHERLLTHKTPYGDAPTPNAPEEADSALLLSDEAVFLWDKTESAVIKVLEALDVRPAIIGRGCSVGYLASSLGFPETAADQANALLNELKATGAKRLYVLGPGDYFTLSQLYP